MTLREKFKILNCTDCDMPYCDIKCTILSTRELEILEKIADDFAIEFVEFLSDWYTKERTKELLEIYKKEKGL